MKPVEFKGQTKVFTKPKSMTNVECGSLAVNFNGTQSVSCWELDETDIKNILERKVIWLGVLGGGHPPVFLTTSEPEQVAEEKNKNLKLQIDLSKIDNIEFDGIDPKDHPDYANAYIVSADYDGKEMTQEQIESIDSGFVHEQILKYLN